jgi:hypothetical protein
MSKVTTRGPIKAEDYGKDITMPAAQNFEKQETAAAGVKPQTDGQKTLSLWSR